MDFDEYQVATVTTAIYPESNTGSIIALAYTIIGLTNEAGEVAGKFKKVLRDGDGDVIDGEVTDDQADALGAELGDVLWYLARTADELGFSLDDIATKNLAKLQSRKTRGTLGGSGDNR